MTLSQFDLISMSQSNYTYRRREGEFSVVQVSFNLQRHTGYFLIQVNNLLKNFFFSITCKSNVLLVEIQGLCPLYFDRGVIVGLILDSPWGYQWSCWSWNYYGADFINHQVYIKLLWWFSCWVFPQFHSKTCYFSLDSRTDLPKVRYATALDWFLLMSFFYCIATLLEFAGVHYFTKVGSGEINALTDDEWEDVTETIEHAGTVHVNNDVSSSQNHLLGSSSSTRKRNSIICPIYNVNSWIKSQFKRHWNL